MRLVRTIRRSAEFEDQCRRLGIAETDPRLEAVLFIMKHSVRLEEVNELRRFDEFSLYAHRTKRWPGLAPLTFYFTLTHDFRSGCLEGLMAPVGDSPSED